MGGSDALEDGVQGSMDNWFQGSERKFQYDGVCSGCGGNDKDASIVI